MKVIAPISITDDNFVGSTLMEADYPVWSSGDIYAIGDRVIRQETHKIYEALVDNIGSSGVRIDSPNAEVSSLAMGNGNEFLVIFVDTLTNMAGKAVIGNIVDGTVVLGTPFVWSSNPVDPYACHVAYSTIDNKYVIVYTEATLPEYPTCCKTITTSDYGLTPSYISPRQVIVSTGELATDLAYAPWANVMIMTTDNGVRYGTLEGGYITQWNITWSSKSAVPGFGYHMSVAVNVTGGTMVILGHQSSTNYPVAAVATVTLSGSSAKEPSFGTAVTLYSSICWIGRGAFDETTGKLLCCYSQFSGTPGYSYLRLQLGTISDTSISFGSSVYTGYRCASSGNWMTPSIALYNTTSAQFAVLYEAKGIGSAGYRGVCVTVSGSTITYSAESVCVDGEVDICSRGGFHAASESFIYAYQDESSSAPAGWGLGGVGRIGLASINSGVIDFGGISGSPENLTTEVNGHTVWLEVGATNKWASFDGKVGTTSSSYGRIRNFFSIGGYDGIALVNVTGDVASVTISGIGFGASWDESADAYSSLGGVIAGYTRNIYGQENTIFISFDDPDGIFGASWDESGDTYTAITDISCHINGAVGAQYDTEISVSRALNGAVSIGQVVFGNVTSLGGTQYGLGTEITDYSIKTTDEWGVTTIKERTYSNNIDCTVIMDKAEFNSARHFLAAKRSKAMVWIPSEDDDYSSAIVYGYYRKARQEIPYPNNAVCTFEIAGLS